MVEFLEQLLKGAGWVIVAHLGFWALLLLGYQRYPVIRSLILWNPWSRRFLTLGYVQLILVGFPPVRRLLFRPFRDVLTADARLDQVDEFAKAAYFTNLEVAPVAPGQLAPGQQPITAALGDLRGRFVLEGNSGRGK